jgi:hypothetical protein
LKALIQILKTLALMFEASILAIFDFQFHLFRSSTFLWLPGAHKKLLEILPARASASRSARLKLVRFALCYSPYTLFLPVLKGYGCDTGHELR